MKEHLQTAIAKKKHLPEVKDICLQNVQVTFLSRHFFDYRIYIGLIFKAVLEFWNNLCRLGTKKKYGPARPASLHRLVVRNDNSAPTQFLAPIDFFKISVLDSTSLSGPPPPPPHLAKYQF
jgi:hypothetical protein